MDKIKITKSLFVIFAVAVLAIGATGAYFSDTEEVLGNTFSTGSLGIYLDDAPVNKVIADVFPMTNMMPGVESDKIYQGIFLEAGSAQPDHLEFRITTHSFVDGGTASTQDEFKKAIILTMFRLNAGGAGPENHEFNKSTIQGLDGTPGSLSLFDVEAAGVLDDAPMSFASTQFRMRYKLDDAAGNKFQGDSIKIDFEIGAAQVAGQPVL